MGDSWLVDVVEERTMPSLVRARRRRARCLPFPSFGSLGSVLAYEYTSSPKCVMDEHNTWKLCVIDDW